MKFQGMVQAPVFRPTEEEFTDPSEYVEKIREKAEPFGICKIIPPDSWKPSFALDETVKFRTKIQNLGRLLQKKSNFKRHCTENGNLEVNSSLKEDSRSYEIVNLKRKKANSNSKLSTCVKCNGTTHLDKAYECLICDRIFHKFCIAPYPKEKKKDEWICKDCQVSTGISYGYLDGGSKTLEEYKREAEEMCNSFLKNFGIPEDASMEQLEEVYWKIIESCDEMVLVRYGSDVDTGRSGSGFKSDGKYGKSPWNVNNFPFSSLSLLKHLGRKISGVMRPWLYFGMMFSTFAWHIEDHHLYSVNYMHHGACKKWYGAQGKDSGKMENAMREYLPDLFEKEPDIHYQLVTMVPPDVFIRKNIQICTLEQNAGEFVITFPGAYHGGFNAGYNCAESTNFALNNWIPFGYLAMKNYETYRMKPVFSFEELIVELVENRSHDASLSEFILPLIRLFSNSECYYRWKAFSNGISNFQKIDNEEDEETKDCSICNHMCHFSWITCKCSEKRASCIAHFEELCECSGELKTVSFRYSLHDFELEIEALTSRINGKGHEKIYKELCLLPFKLDDMERKMSEIANIWSSKLDEILKDGEVFNFSVIQELILESDRFSWAGSSVDFARSRLELLDDFCEWRDSFCISTAGSKIIRDNEESIRTLLNCSDPTIDLAFYFITEMLAYYYKVSKSQKLEQLEKVLEYAFSFYNKMPSGPTKKALSLKISEFQTIIEKGQLFRNKARGFRKQKSIREEDLQKFIESVRSECPVAIDEFVSVLKPVQESNRSLHF